ncbi:uncharacterized protein LOC134191848 isoform X2 [Corticium candelabrum]|uniref:uncharacterized protein LOC134191848 isoform X2 n=1 Tax=Corticium candelabrum TaxID=121492 RepID=UPI002E277454|nr:uncharacterized protein LOC134191848 isoform X2 [Corticium candelabrum]
MPVDDDGQEEDSSVVVPDSDKEDNASFSSCRLDSEESTVMISSRSTSHEQTPISRSGVEDEEEGCNTERDVDATAALKKGKGKRKRTDDTGRTAGQKKMKGSGTEKKTRNEHLVQLLTTKLKEMDDDMLEKEAARREKEEESRRQWEEEQDNKRMTFMKDIMHGLFEAMKK